MRLRTTLIAIVTLATALTIQAAQKPDPAKAAMEAAKKKEVIDGDLNAAIKQYKEIVSKYKSQRAIAAEALFHMAESYRKLGDAQAREVYERIAREYGEQKEAAAARERLGQSVAGAGPVLGDRVVWTNEAVLDGGRVSPDGRFISYVDWIRTGNLMLHNVVTGETRPLTGNKDWSGGSATGSAFSPDGKLVAYGWQTETNSDEIRIVSVEGAGIPQSRRVIGNDDIQAFSPTDWSPDGKWLAVAVLRKDRTRQIGLVEVSGGEYRALTTTGWEGPGNVRFSPDGRYIVYDLPANDNTTQRDVFLMALDGNRKTPLVQHDANENVVGWSPDGSTLLFASDRAGSTGLWALRVANGTPQAPPTLLKPNIVGTPMGLTVSGALYIARGASTQALHVAPIDLESGKLTGPPVFQTVGDASLRPAWSPDGRYLAYHSGSSLSIRSVESGKVRELRPELRYFFSISWMPDAQSFIVSARNSKGRDGIYRIDAQTEAVSLVKDVQTGGVKVSSDGKKIYYNDGAQNSGDEPRRYVEHDLTSAEIRQVMAGIRLPDSRGVAAIRTDQVAKTSAVVLRPVTGGGERELVRVSLPERFENRLQWTSNGEAVVAIKTQNDGKQEEVWIIPVNGSSARKLNIDANTLIGSDIHLDPQGKQIAFFTGKSLSEVWVLENIFSVRH